MNDAWETCILEQDPHRDHWNHKAHGFERLCAKIEEGDWVVVLDKSWPPLAPAYAQVNGQWQLTRHIRETRLRQCLESQVQTIQRQQREQLALQSQNQPSSAEPQSEPASGPGNRVASLGPHVDSEAKTNLSKSSDPVASRVAQNTMLRNSPQFAADMEKVGVTEAQITRMSAKEVPLGFESAEQFTQFKSELDGALNSEGLKDAEIGLKGTSTTFYSESPGKPLGHHWDAIPSSPGDYDLNITGPTMVEKLQNAGIAPSEKYGVFRT